MREKFLSFKGRAYKSIHFVYPRHKLMTIKTYLVTKHCRAVDSFKHCILKATAFWRNVFLEKEAIFTQTVCIWKRLQEWSQKASGMKPFSGIWKHTILCKKGVVFFTFLVLRWPIEPKLCYFMHMLGYTKWRYWSLIITRSVSAFTGQGHFCKGQISSASLWNTFEGKTRPSKVLSLNKKKWNNWYITLRCNLK